MIGIWLYSALIAGVQSDECLDSGCPAGEVTYMQRGNGVCSVLCNSVICKYDAGDCITRDQPLSVYVAANTQVYSADYINLSTAFSELWAPYSTVYLRDGTHPLLQFNSISSIAIPGEVIIRTLLCSESIVFGCANQYATIQLSRDLVTLQVLTNLTFVNVMITGHFSLRDGCECVYCPAIHYNSSVWLNDRNEVINLNSIATTCQQYNTSVLIEVQSNATLTLMNVTFSDITHQLKSLIESQCGDITLSNVTFHNIISSEVEGSAVIRLNGFQCGSLQYTGGTVELLNNGFELSVNWTFGGFLLSIGTKLVNINNVIFQYNALSSTLINVTQTRNVNIRNCTISNNLADLAVLLIISENCNIESIQVISNFANRSIMSLTGNCTIRASNLVSNTAALSILVIAPWLSEANSSIATVNLIANSAQYVVLVRNSNSLTMRNVLYDRNGLNPLSPFSSYLSSNATYAKSNPSIPAIMCFGVASTSSVSSVFVTDTVFQSSVCLWPGLSTSGVTARIALSDTAFNSNTGFSSLQLSASAVLSNVTFKSNSNLQSDMSACISVSSIQQIDISISNSAFIQNQAVTGTVMQAIGVQNLTIRNSVFQSNSALTSFAGIVFQRDKDIPAHLLFEDCIFASNTANSSGVLSIVRNEQFLVSSQFFIQVMIYNCSFFNNSASIQGGAVTTYGFGYLNGLILNSSFLNNSCSEGGSGAYLEFVSGSFDINNTAFVGNSGPAGAALYHHNHNVNANRSNVLLSNCSFASNTGTDIVRTEGIESSILVTDSLLFQGNLGSAVSILSGHWIDANSVFTRNKADSGSAVVLVNSTLQISSASFSHNSAYQKGGAVFLTRSSNMTCWKCAFLDNRSGGAGGAIYADFGSTCVGDSLTFVQNLSGDYGAAVYLSRSTLSLLSSTLRRNQANTYGAIYLTASILSMALCDINENLASARSPGIVASQSVIRISNSSFHDQYGAAGGCGFFTDQTYIVVDRLTATNCSASSGGVFVVISLSDFTMSESQVTHCSSSSDGGLLASRISTIRISNSTFSNLSSAYTSGALFLLQSTVYLFNSTFASIYGSVGNLFMSSGTVSFSDFSFVEARTGCALLCAECGTLNVTKSRFYQNRSQKGGAIYGYSSAVILNAQSLIEENLFENNSAGLGGALYFNNLVFLIQKNLFRNNSAVYGSNIGKQQTGSGGAIYSRCPNYQNCGFRYIENSFYGNWADISGGVAVWFDRYPVIENNTMKENSAPYGANIASFPVRLALYDNSISEYLSVSEEPLIATLENIASGQLFTGNLKLALVDHYDQVVTTDSLSSAHIFIGSSSGLSVSGNIEVPAVNGIFDFTNIRISGQPGSTQSLKIASSAISPLWKALYADPVPYYPTVTVALELRACLSGESISSNECYPCPVNTFSLVPTQPCLTCPKTAICYGTNVMVPRPGYWRPDANLDLFIECLNTDACIGSPSGDSVSLTGQCALGYHGNLCASCTSDFSGDAFGVCSQCPSLATNIGLCVVLALALLFLLTIVVLIAIRSATRPRSELAIYVKIFMNYLQMIMVAASLKLNWPNYVSAFLHSQQQAGNASDQFFSIDCLLKQAFTTSVYYPKLTVLIVVPGVLLISAVVAWSALFLCSKAADITSKATASAVLILFVLHTSITKETFSMFSCLELLPGQYWLEREMSIRCWDADHMNRIFTLAVPAIAIWVIGLPTLCLVFLIRKRRVLKDFQTRLKFSFLYKGYQPELYYWEFIILYRKIVIVSTAVFLETVSISVQALSMMAAIIICIFLQMHYRPFNAKGFNQLELTSLCASSFTIFAGLYFQTNSTEFLRKNLVRFSRKSRKSAGNASNSKLADVEDPENSIPPVHSNSAKPESIEAPYNTSMILGAEQSNPE